MRHNFFIDVAITLIYAGYCVLSVIFMATPYGLQSSDATATQRYDDKVKIWEVSLTETEKSELKTELKKVIQKENEK